MKAPRFFVPVLVLALLATSSGVSGAATSFSASTAAPLYAQNGATYYVDNGHPQADDSNPGTEGLPWEHCPGMPGWSGSTELEAGDLPE